MTPDRKRAPYGKRGLNKGVLETTGGVLDDVIGLTPFGIYCKSCKTKIAFSTFKNHIRDAHPDCFSPQDVNYAAASREYERLVDEERERCTDIEQYVIGGVVDRFQCTGCQCLFDNKSNAKRHFLSMKTGCTDAGLQVVKCKQTICYRAVTLTDLDRMIAEAKEKVEESESSEDTEEEPTETVDDTETNRSKKTKKRSTSKKTVMNKSAKKVPNRTGGGDESPAEQVESSDGSASPENRTDDNNSSQSAEEKSPANADVLPSTRLRKRRRKGVATV